MKIFKIFSLTDSVKSFLLTYPNIFTCSHSQIIDLLKERYLLYPALFKSSVEKLGHQCFETIFNCEILQKAWCEENNVLWSKEHWETEILIQQIKLFKPTVIYFEREAFSQVPRGFIKSLKQRFSFVKLVVGYWGAQISEEKTFQNFQDVDLIFCLDHYLHAQFQKKGIPSYVVPYAWDCAFPLKRDKIHDVVFLGSTGYGYLDHEKRFKDLQYLLKHTKIKIWGDERQISWQNIFAKKILSYTFNYCPENLWNLLLKNSRWISKKLQRYLDMQKTQNYRELNAWYYKTSPLKKKYNERILSPLYGLNYLKTLAQSSVVFNRHVDQKMHFGNIRCFEVTGAGACLLTDRGDLMKDLFEEDEIVSYSSINEAVEKIDFLLTRPDKALQIASKGQKRTLRDHTTFCRCMDIDKKIKTLLKH